MDGSQAALSSLLIHHKVVESLVSVVILNKLRVDDGTRLRILKAVAVLQEDPLIDSLVHNNQSKLWNVSLVAEAVDHLSELTDLLGEDLLPHLLANTIAEDDNLSWHVANIIAKALEGLPQAIV